MKKIIAIVAILVIAIGAGSAIAKEGAMTPAAFSKATQDTWIDQIGDWFATLGKTPEERDVIVAQRRADRVAQRTAAQAEKAMSEAGSQVQDAAQDAGKALDKGIKDITNKFKSN